MTSNSTAASTPPRRAVDRMLALIAERVSDPRVLAAMRATPRHEFVRPSDRHRAYEDAALSIGERQTISQPLIVAIMSEALELTGSERVLEVGTGSGYQAAILARLAAEVVSVERIVALRERAAATLARLAITNVRCLAAGATLGASQHAPYDSIIVTAAAPDAPQALLDQLRDGGRMVAPIGSRDQQELVVLTRTGDSCDRRVLTACRFVPLFGEGAFEDR
ncbi:MAG TPA: protein-L-isoaspartate(D-aspartate) O-methyltransferase [Dehalococcoidia bacterium]|nr:protein-L-isoaspartate(D-aspartate) O-methyltransferase [Dehalococcoidia bacterium]